MKNFTKGQVFYGKTHVKLINNVIGTHYHDYDASLVDLQQFGSDGIFAWFVFMNGQTHGWHFPHHSWLWQNYLSDDETHIREHYVSHKKSTYVDRRAETGYMPFRVAFQLNSYESNPYPVTYLKENCHCCQFKGVYRIARFLEKDLSVVEYERASDHFALGEDESYNAKVTHVEDLCNSPPLYQAHIEQAKLSSATINMLKNGGIRYVWELLTLDVSDIPAIKQEINTAIYSHFS